MKKLRPLAALCLWAAFAPAVFAGKTDIAGYTGERAELAASLPAQIVVLNSRVRPQVGLDHRAIAGEKPRAGQTWATDAAIASGSGVLPALAVAAMERQWFRNRVQEAFAPIQTAGCDLRIDESLPSAVSGALRKSPWGGSTPVNTVVAPGGSLKRAVDEDKPRQILSLSSSLAPDLEALVTTLEIQAYAPTDGASRWQREPIWRDEFIVVSDVVQVAGKTQADIDRLAAQEQARYQASGNAAAIRKLNAERGGDRFERKRVLALQQEHERAMKTAMSADWSPEDVKRERATMWSADGCARMRTAVDQAGADLGTMLDDLYAQRLPRRLGFKDGVPSDGANGRHVHSLPGGIYVYRVDGDQVPLGYREDLLD